MYLYYATNRYALYRDAMGHYSLNRLEDSAHSYFQTGDDVDTWERNLMTFQYYLNEVGESEAVRFFDDLCATYDDILTGDLELYGPRDEMGRQLGE